MSLSCSFSIIMCGIFVALCLSSDPDFDKFKTVGKYHHQNHYHDATFCNAILQSPKYNFPQKLLPFLQSNDFIHDFILSVLKPLEKPVRNIKSDFFNLGIIDVDNSSSLLFKNQVIVNKLSRSNLTIIAMTYSPGVCARLDSLGLQDIYCFYSEKSVNWLLSLWKNLTENTKPPTSMQLIMLGRLSMFRHLACFGYSVFMGDADVVYFRNPFDFVLKNADIMLTAERLHDRDFIYSSTLAKAFPKRKITLNNGVWFFRGSSDAVKRYALEFTMYNWVALTKETCLSNLPYCEIFRSGFIQFALNSLHRTAGFLGEIMSLETWNNETNNGGLNKAGECCDCLYGPWKYASKYINESVIDRNVSNQLNVATFPMMRFTSNVNDRNFYKDGSTLAKMTKLTKEIFQKIISNITDNPWEDQQCKSWDGQSYPGPVILVHAAGVKPSGVQFDAKESWFQTLGAWFL